MHINFTRRLALLTLPLLAAPALANERHFTFSYESAVLPKGAKELEVWATPRYLRDDYYGQIDTRLELEVGVTDKVMTAFYLNATGVTAETGPGMLESGAEITGVSNEWKVKLADPVADALGVGLYGEVTVGPAEFELEAKLLLDKKLGSMLLVANLIGEIELEIEAEGDEVEAEPEGVIAATFGASWELSEHFHAGIELVNENDLAHKKLQHSALLLGPVISYATEEWWVAASVLPQLPALYHHADQTYDLESHERVLARILVSFHL